MHTQFRARKNPGPPLPERDANPLVIAHFGCRNLSSAWSKRIRNPPHRLRLPWRTASYFSATTQNDSTRMLRAPLFPKSKLCAVRTSSKKCIARAHSGVGKPWLGRSAQLFVEGGSGEVLPGRYFSRATPMKVAQPKYSREVASAKSLPGRWFGETTLREVVRPKYSREGGSAELLPGRWFRRVTPGKVLWASYSSGGGSVELLSGRWFGRTTPGKVVQPNSSRGGGSGELLQGRCFGETTLRNVVRRRCSQGSGSAELLPGRSFGRIASGTVLGGATRGRWFGETMVSRCQNEMQTI
jgi:hypothetical protein